MSLFDIVLLFSAGFLSSVVNAIAGGGTFLTFGAMTLAGVPPIMANATSSVTQFPGYVTSALAYRKEIREAGREVWVIAGLSMVGSLAGALRLFALRLFEPLRLIQKVLRAEHVIQVLRLETEPAEV